DDVGFQLLDILRMNSFEPLTRVRVDAIRVKRQHFLRARTELHPVGLQIPVPETVVCAPHYQAELLLTLCKRFERLFLVRQGTFQLGVPSVYFEEPSDG